MTDLDSVADELYALPPAELERFGARRTELAAAARAAGDRELARQIGALKKPVQAAALANALVREHPEAMRELSELAGRLRDAHRHLRGPELRELSEQRQRWLARLAELAPELAGRPVGEQVLSQLRATFEAAIADEAAEEAVKSGRLTVALSYSGFGEVDITDAVAAPRRLRAVPDLVEPAGKARPAPAERSTDSSDDSGGQAARRRAELALQRADAAAEAAERAVAEAADELADADTAERAALDLLRRLEEELDEAKRKATAAAKAAVAAGREHARRERAFERADQARRQAEAELDELLEAD